MKHLLHYIKKEVSYTSNSGVIYLDLPKDAKISMLMLDVEMYSSSTIDVTNSILICVEKIHVLLDGAKIAYTMQPEVGSYDYFLRTGKMPPHDLRSRAASFDVMRLPILFGRYEGDPEYGLDTGLYGSAAVEIEYTLDTTDYDTTTTNLTAWILVPVEPVSYRGFIRSRIIEDKAAPTASSVHTVEFPSTFPLLAAFARLYDLDEYPTTNVTDVDFQADQGRSRIFNGRIEDLIRMNDLILGHDIHGCRMFHQAKSDDYPSTFFGLAHSYDVEVFAASNVVINVTSWKGHRCKVDSSVGSTTAPVWITPIGQMPFGCLLLGDWRDKPYDAPAHADLKCDFTIGTSLDFLTTCVLEVVEGVL